VPQPPALSTAPLAASASGVEVARASGWQRSSAAVGLSLSAASVTDPAPRSCSDVPSLGLPLAGASVSGRAASCCDMIFRAGLCRAGMSAPCCSSSPSRPERSFRAVPLWRRARSSDSPRACDAKPLDGGSLPSACSPARVRLPHQYHDFTNYHIDVMSKTMLSKNASELPVLG